MYSMRYFFSKKLRKSFTFSSITHSESDKTAEFDIWTNEAYSKPEKNMYIGEYTSLSREKIDPLEKMLSIQWWNWSDEKISEAAELFNDVPRFLNKYAVRGERY